MIFLNGIIIIKSSSGTEASDNQNQLSLYIFIKK